MNAKILFAAAAIAAAPLVAQPAQAQTVGYVTVDLILRTGPDINYPPVALLPAGTPLTVYGCIDGFLWCDVGWEYSRGWVAGQYVAINYGPQPMPLTLYGPRFGLPIISFIFGNYWDQHYRSRPWYAERDRWQSWDYRSQRWNPGYDAKKWEDPKRGYYDPKRSQYDPKRGYYDPKRGYYDPKQGTYDPKGKPPSYDPKRGTYDPKGRPAFDPKKGPDPKGKPAQFDPKRGAPDPKKAADPKKRDPGKKDDDKGKR